MNSYFFIAVSTEHNLRICKEWGYAGFTNTVNGLWAFLDIKIGDFVTFLYGARAHNLYKVVGKKAYLNGENLGPWPKMHLDMYNKDYYFPYRLELERVRTFDEFIARKEFEYLANNLLKRGGYRKTHFQVDSLSLFYASKIGVENFSLPKIGDIGEGVEFEPHFARGKVSESEGVFPLREMILQALIRESLSDPNNMRKFLEDLGEERLKRRNFEALGELALSKGFVDIFIKEIEPKGTNYSIAVEVKLNSARGGKIDDIQQIKNYVKEIGPECKAGVLIAEKIPRTLKKEDAGIHLFEYSFDSLDLKEPHTFEELLSSLVLEKVWP